MYVHLITHTVRYIEKCFICQMRSDILQSFIKILPNRLLQKLIKKKKKLFWNGWVEAVFLACMYISNKNGFPPKYCLCIRTYISTLEAKTLWFWTSIRSSGAQDFSMLSYLVDLYCCCLRAVSSFTRSEWGESMVLQVIVPWCDYLILKLKL